MMGIRLEATCSVMVQYVDAKATGAVYSYAPAISVSVRCCKEFRGSYMVLLVEFGVEARGMEKTVDVEEANLWARSASDW